MLWPTVPTFAGQEAAVTPPGQRELTCALDQLAALLGAGEGDQASVDEVAELSRRVREDALRVVVAGEAKRGKSTLINALLARAVLPTGVVPLTAVPTTLGYGESEAVEVRYTCLLYTSDAADEEDSVDLGGRRIIKKKKKNKKKKTK